MSQLSKGGLHPERATILSRGVCCLAVSLACLSGLACLSPLPAATGKTQVAEWLQYLSPLPEKTYLNESQDRLIKKKKFKLDNLPDVQPAINKEQGFFAVIPWQKASDPAFIESVVSRSDVNGLSLLIPWRQLEPQEEEYNWKLLDNLCKVLAAKNKSLILRVSVCGVDSPSSPRESQDSADVDPQSASRLDSDTPGWVFEAGSKSFQYTGQDGRTHLMPLFWDSTYLAKWSTFIQDLADRYDSNSAIHSIGITGGGVRGGTGIVPDFFPVPQATGTDDLQTYPDRKEGTNSRRKASNKNYKALLKQLEKEQEATQKRMSDNWKYIADIFLAAFPNARLNFDINPPVDSRAGQNSLDEISDYLIHRYGQRIYLTRQNVDSAKHGFDQYRILLKFRGDTITGLQLTPSIPSADLNKLCRHALDDGISFAELPLALITSTDSQVKAALAMLASHIGYQLLSKEARLPEKARAGEPLQAAFRFVNLGAAEPARPIRNLDKDVASSLRVQIELSDRKERTVVVSLHTPGIPSNAWGSGQLVSWEEELRMPELAAGVYSIHMSLVDEEANRRICFLDARLPGEPTPTIRCPLGTIEITPGAAAASSATPAAAPAR